MQVNLSNGAVWDTEAASQSKEAVEWLSQKRITPADTFEKDEYGRPKRWVWNLGNAELIIENVYISQSHDWSLKDKVVTIKAL